MRVINELYIVYSQDVEGRDCTPYYFADVVDACYFAIINEGKMAYGIPTVQKITQCYDTDNMIRYNAGKFYYELSKEEIIKYAAEFEV